MFERYTEQARKAVLRARHEASLCGSSSIEPEHLLLGLLHEDAQLSDWLSLSPAIVGAFGERLQASAPRGKAGSPGDLPLSQPAKRVIAYAAREAETLRHTQINTKHLVLGISCEESSAAAKMLRECGWTTGRLRAGLSQSAAGSSSPKRADAPAPGPFRNLVEQAAGNPSALLVGRKAELERIVQILSRRTRNNVVLVGEAGVGKTAIVEGLAQRIAQGTVPAFLEDRRLLALDATLLIGSGRRTGSLEAALEDLRDPSGTILFIRGLFNLATAGSTWRLVEAMHALEPLLAHGGMQCIATGSPPGLRATIERAGMLARHFETVVIAPVDESTAIRIASALKPQFERFHRVAFAEGAIEMAVRASGLFLPGRQLPDRAIDLIDEAAAAVKLRQQPATSEEVHTVTPRDIVIAAAARAGANLAAAERLIETLGTGELAMVTAELAAPVAPESREWLPLLAAWLVRCSPAEAEGLAKAISSAKSRLAASPGGAPD